jgi:hypothetical protein
VLVSLLIDEQLSTLETHTPENFHELLEELRIVNWAGECKMSKMTWAIVIVLAT